MPIPTVSMRQANLTIPSGITVRSGTNGGYLSSNATLTVQGAILSDLSGHTITVYGNPLVNNSLIQASNGGSLNINGTWTNAAGATIGISGGGTFTLSGPWSNDGTIQADNSQVQVSGTFTVASLGTFNVTGTASVVVYGVLDNTGHTFNLSTLPGWDFMQGEPSRAERSEAALLSFLQAVTSRSTASRLLRT